MKQRVNVRPYRKRDGTRVSGHRKRNPGLARRRNAASRERILKKNAMRWGKYVHPGLGVVSDIAETVKDIRRYP